MSAKRNRRLAHKLKAAEVLEKSGGPVMNLLAEVVSDLSEELEGCSQIESDLALAGELSHRIDALIRLNDPIAELIDGAIAFFIALAAIGIWRQVARQEGLRGARLDKLRARLKDRGPRMAPVAKRRLQRRIKRLQKITQEASP